MSTAMDVTAMETTDAPSVRPGAQPLAPAGASYAGAALAVIVIVLGGLGIREALVAAGWIGGQRWVADAVGAVDGAAPASWMTIAGVAVVVLGAVLVLLAVKPRRRRAVAVESQTAIYIDLSDVARIATAAAESVAGVTSARSTATRKKVTVRCSVTGFSDSTLAEKVDNAVSAELAGLRSTPRLKVRLAKGGRS